MNVIDRDTVNAIIRAPETENEELLVEHIKELKAQISEKDDHIQELEAERESLQCRISDMESTVSDLEARLEGLE